MSTGPRVHRHLGAGPHPMIQSSPVSLSRLLYLSHRRPSLRCLTLTAPNCVSHSRLSPAASCVSLYVPLPAVRAHTFALRCPCAAQRTPSLMPFNTAAADHVALGPSPRLQLARTAVFSRADMGTPPHHHRCAMIHASCQLALS